MDISYIRDQANLSRYCFKSDMMGSSFNFVYSPFKFKCFDKINDIMVYSVFKLFKPNIPNFNAVFCQTVILLNRVLGREGGREGGGGFLLP